VQHGEDGRRGAERDELGAEFDRVVNQALRRVDAPVAGALHRVAPLRLVERRQVDPGRQFQQPHLGRPAHPWREAALRGGGRRGQQRADRARGDHHQQGRDGGADAFGRRAGPEQAVEHADDVDQPDPARDPGAQLEPGHRERVGGAGPPGQQPRLAQQSRQPAQHPAERGGHRLGGRGQPVRDGQFVGGGRLGLVAVPRHALMVPGPATPFGAQDSGRPPLPPRPPP
jgi:hypothetical protein